MDCLNCQTPVPQTAGKRPKLYCSETCRVAFFRQKKAGEGVKKGKGRPRKHIPISPVKVYDAIKWPITAGEFIEYGVPDNQPSEETGRTVTFEPSIGKVTVIDPVSIDLPALVRKAEQDTRKVLNPDDPKTKQKKEPAEGTNAYYLKYGAFSKKDILK